MGKDSLKFFCALAFVLLAGYGVYNSQKTVELSALELANVEALAGGEVVVGPWYCVGDFNICLHDGQGILLGLKQHF